MGLVVGKRPTSPTVPMILAASMGPMPKISVRVVPEVSTSRNRCARLGWRSFDRVCGCGAGSAKPVVVVGGGGGARSPPAGV